MKNARRKMSLFLAVILLLLCGCSNENKESVEGILTRIAQMNTEEVLRDEYSSVFIKTIVKGFVDYSVYDDQKKATEVFFDDEGNLITVSKIEGDFCYIYDASEKNFFCAQLEDNAYSVWEDLSTTYTEYLEAVEVKNTNAFTIVTCKLKEDKKDDFLAAVQIDGSEYKDFEVVYTCDKNTLAIYDANLTGIDKDGNTVQIMENQVTYNTTDQNEEYVKLITEHLKGITGYRKVSINTVEEDGTITKKSYNVPIGDEFYYNVPENYVIDKARSSMPSDPKFEKDMVIYMTVKGNEDIPENNNDNNNDNNSSNSNIQDDSSAFVLLSEAIPDAILEIRYYSTYNFVGDRIDGYEEPLAFLTKEAAKALKEVSDELVNKGYRLKIYDAYRPQSAVDHFVRWSKDTSDTRMKEYFYPELDKSVLFEQGYIMEKSGHSRGSTVDLTIVDMKTGKEVDMGGTFDYFGELSHPSYTGITTEQYGNRMILREAMLGHGFQPLDEEWWHFTLKNEPYPDTYFDFPINSDQVKSE